MILSDELKIGDCLPSRRDNASQLNISHPMLHQALVDLEVKSLVNVDQECSSMSSVPEQA